MYSAKIIAVLNRLMKLHHRSLASYLYYASPAWIRGDEKAKATLSLIASQQLEIVDRAGELIGRQHGVADYGAYPMVYTAYHDLSFTFLLDRLTEEQQRIVAALEQCAAESRDESRVHELVQESLGMAKGHLDSLRELKSPRPNPVRHATV